jgi:hypothetical protein
MLRSFGLAAMLPIIEGSEADFKAILINKGIAPIVFVAARIAAIIIRYRQKEFLPEKEDSR